MTDMISRADALKCCEDQFFNTMMLTCNPPKSSAAWAAFSAISDLPAVQVGIKPLEWVERDGKLFNDQFSYVIAPENFQSRMGYFVRFGGKYIYKNTIVVNFNCTAESAKAEAQEHHEARTRAALTVTPADQDKMAAMERLMPEVLAALDAMIFNVSLAEDLRSAIAEMKGITNEN